MKVRTKKIRRCLEKIKVRNSEEQKLKL